MKVTVHYRSSLLILLFLSVSCVTSAQVTAFESTVTIKNGANLFLQASAASPSDAGDLVFSKFNGEEIARIYSVVSEVDQGSIYFSFGPAIVPKMTIKPNGYVGIGTHIPNEMLSVNGNIRAKEIKVESNNWPDYVFDDNYKIQPLQVVEQFIKQNKHLPGMPSAEFNKLNGLSLGETIKSQQEKIEELTLYLIEGNKSIIELTRRITDLESKKN